MARVSAITFDFNGTMSNDEPILCAIFQGALQGAGPAAFRAGVLRRAGRALGRGDRDHAARRGLSACGGRGRRTCRALPRSRRRPARPSTRRPARPSVTRRRESRPRSCRWSFSPRSSRWCEPPGSIRLFAAIVSGPRRDARKAAPRELSQSARAARSSRLERRWPFEDTEPGIASATGAGVRCIAVRGTSSPRLVSGRRTSWSRRSTSTSSRASLEAVTRPLVIAHRGASAELPENTLPAFERAIEIGADLVEFDATPGVGRRAGRYARPTPRRGGLSRRSQRCSISAGAGSVCSSS